MVAFVSIRAPCFRTERLKFTVDVEDAPGKFQSALRAFARSDPEPKQPASEPKQFQSALRAFARSDLFCLPDNQHQRQVSIRAPCFRTERPSRVTPASAASRVSIRAPCFRTERLGDGSVA